MPVGILIETMKDVAKDPTNVNVVMENVVVFTSSDCTTPQEYITPK